MTDLVVPIVTHAMNLRGRDGGAKPELDELASIRAASGGSSRSYITHAPTGRGTPLTVPGPGVRRLTPIECERLQGFPDDWTLVPGVKCPDSRRYAATGDAVTVPVAEWLGRRIELAAQIVSTRWLAAVVTAATPRHPQSLRQALIGAVSAAGPNGISTRVLHELMIGNWRRPEIDGRLARYHSEGLVAVSAGRVTITRSGLAVRDAWATRRTGASA